MHLLIADDDRVSREILQRLLLSFGRFQVEAVADGTEAWARLSAQQPLFDAVLLDIVMPGLNGFDVVERMRRDERLRRLPVIFCTAANDRPSVLRASQLAVAHYIVKPYAHAVVREKIEFIEGQLRPSLSREDPGSVAARLGLDAASLEPLRESALQEAQQLTTGLRTALHTARWHGFSERVNGLKGGCLTLGLPRLATALGSLEETLDQSSGPAGTFGIDPLLVDDALATVEQELQALAVPA